MTSANPRTGKVLAEITRESFVKVVGRCTHVGCEHLTVERQDSTTAYSVGFLREWFKTHVLETGHTVVVEEGG